MNISGVRILKQPKFKDKRGVITELFRDYFVRSVTHTVSLPKTLRGLHVQEWDKFVYPANGEIFIVLVDMRKYSPTYLKKDKILMKDKNRGPIFIPKGVANSYLVTGRKPVDYFYFNSSNYDEKETTTINYNSPKLAITWPIKKPIVSLKDKNAPIWL